MTESPALTVLGSVGVRSGTSELGRFEGVEAVEIVAPDRHSALLLLDHAAHSFLVEIVSGSIVRFRRPQGGGDWVVDVLALVERWLGSVPLPCAKVVSRGNAYLVRAPNHGLEI